MSENYNAEAIEVLNGLEPVQRRHGMYTDTVRPNHLGQEVIDNSVDEVLAEQPSWIKVILHEDQSLEVLTTDAVCRLIFTQTKEYVGLNSS